MSVSPTTRPHVPAIGPAPLTDEWFDVRRTMFTSSRMFDVVTQPSVPYCEIVHGTEFGAFSDEQIERMQTGRDLEPIILGRHAERNGLGVFGNVPLLIHPEFPFIGATVDGIGVPMPAGKRGYSVTPSDQDDVGGILRWVLKRPAAVAIDAKNVGTFMVAPKEGIAGDKFGAPDTDQVPLRILLQAQTHLAVTGLGVCEIPAMVDGVVRSYRVKRHDGLVSMIERKSVELWERIERRDPPPPEWGSSEADKVMQALHGVTEELGPPLPESALQWWRTYERLGETIRRHERMRNIAKQHVRAIMGTKRRRVIDDKYELAVSEIAETVVPETKRGAYWKVVKRKRRR